MKRSHVLFTLFATVLGCSPQSSGANSAVVVPPQPTQPNNIATTNRVDAGLAETPNAQAEPQVEGAPAPAVRPLDPTMKVDGSGLLLGDNATHAWLLIDDATVVVDKTTGCVTESYPKSPLLKGQSGGPDGLSAEQTLEQADVLAAIRDHVGLGRRFGAQSDRFTLNMVWSLDGRHIYLEMGHSLYHSADGGRSFVHFIDQGSRMEMATDGKHVVYEHCGDTQCGYYAQNVDSIKRTTPPVFLTKGQTFLLQFNEVDKQSRAIFWRSEASSICLDTFELEHGKKEAFCTPFPVAKVVGPWPGREWLSVSPSGKYGIVKWEEHRLNLAHVPALTHVISLVDLKTGAIVKTLTNLRGEVDDDGNMVLDSVSEGNGDHTYYFPKEGTKKLLGDNSFMSWKNKTAMLGVYRKGNLGQRKCDLVKLVKTP